MINKEDHLLRFSVGLQFGVMEKAGFCALINLCSHSAVSRFLSTQHYTDERQSEAGENRETFAAKEIVPLVVKN